MPTRLVARAISCLLCLLAALALPAQEDPAPGQPGTDPGAEIARVGSRAITRAMLDAAVGQALGTRYFHRDISPRRRLELERQQLEELILRELDLLGGLERGLELPIGEGWRVQKAQQAAGGEAYLRSIEASGIAPADHARLVAETLLAEEAHRRFVTDRAAVTDEEVRAAYDADPSRWYLPEAVRIQHIFIRVAVMPDADQVQAAEAEARRLKQQLVDGASFEELAAAHSDDMYRIQGGDLGWVHRGRLEPGLEEAAWAANVGELVGPVRSPEGFHLARVLDRRERRPLPYSEAEPMIRGVLEQERLEEVESGWYDALRRQHQVVILDRRLAPDAP